MQKKRTCLPIFLFEILTFEICLLTYASPATIGLLALLKNRSRSQTPQTNQRLQREHRARLLLPPRLPLPRHPRPEPLASRRQHQHPPARRLNREPFPRPQPQPQLARQRPTPHSGARLAPRPRPRPDRVPHTAQGSEAAHGQQRAGQRWVIE